MAAKTSRTRLVLRRALLVLFAVYLLLAVATRRPLLALGSELGGLLLVWAVYVVRFAFNSPLALAPEVLWFRAEDRLRPPPAGAIVFTGSSTIAHWMSLADDMAPLPVVNRGINGARLNQIAHYVEQLVLRHRPRAVVLYAGENDLAGFLGSRKQSPAQVALAFQRFCETIRGALPAAHVCFISIKPPTRRTAAGPAFQAANALVRAYCASHAGLQFIDVVPALLGADGSPLPGVFEADGIHLNEAGYRILTSAVKPFLTP